MTWDALDFRIEHQGANIGRFVDDWVPPAPGHSGLMAPNFSLGTGRLGRQTELVPDVGQIHTAPRGGTLRPDMAQRSTLR